MLNAPSGDFWRIVPLYSLGLFFLIGPYAAALFLIGESFPSHIRATASSFVNAMGQVGAIAAGFGVTWTLSQGADWVQAADRKSTRLNSSHLVISYAVFCLKKKITDEPNRVRQLVHLLHRADRFRRRGQPAHGRHRERCRGAGSRRVTGAHAARPNSQLVRP